MSEGKCNLPPEGWYCTREKGHDGPCAAYQNHNNTEILARRAFYEGFNCGASGVFSREKAWEIFKQILAAEGRVI